VLTIERGLSVRHGAQRFAQTAIINVPSSVEAVPEKQAVCGTQLEVGATEELKIVNKGRR
jgi:hypothetical protein